MYFAVLNRDGWDWLFVFLFAACAVMRLARFNIEQAGTAKTYFHGLPSPAAGITLASYYWFSQSSLYNYGAIGDLPWHVLLRFLMAALAFLMISNVPYPVFPRTGFRSLRAHRRDAAASSARSRCWRRGGSSSSSRSRSCYVAWGLVRWMFSGLFERRQPTIPYDLSEGEDDEDEDEDDAFEPIDSQVHASRQSRARAAATCRRVSASASRASERRDTRRATDRARARSRDRPERGDTSPRAERPARPAERAPEREPRREAERDARRARSARSATSATRASRRRPPLRRRSAPVGEPPTTGVDADHARRRRVEDSSVTGRASCAARAIGDVREPASGRRRSAHAAQAEAPSPSRRAQGSPGRW